MKPLFVSKQNSEALTGVEFRWWKAHFPHLVRKLGRKAVIPAADLEHAVQDGIRKSFETPEAVVALDAAEQVRDLLRRCDNVRKAGGR